jgi:hypothetical protein
VVQGEGCLSLYLVIVTHADAVLRLCLVDVLPDFIHMMFIVLETCSVCLIIHVPDPK